MEKPVYEGDMVTCCAALCTPCLRVALGQIRRHEWEDIRSMTAAAPPSWSSFLRELAQACHARLAEKGIVSE